MSRSTEGSRSSADRPCPVCDSALVDGQGLFTCSSCGWVGTIATDERGIRWEDHSPRITP